MATRYNIGSRDEKVQVVTAATTLDEADSGKTLVLKAAEGVAITLPEPKLGLNFRFVVGLAFGTSNWTVVTNANATIIHGSVIVNGASVNGSAEDTISFVNSAESLGDYVDVVSDGTNWYVSGVGHAAGAITLTDAA